MPPKRAAAELERMVASMRHESFYVTGTWMDENLGIYVGWAERDDPGRTEMPLDNETGSKVLMFSGEEFPEPGTARRLMERGHRLIKGNCAHLAHVAEEDAAFPASLNGQFQGLLVDRTVGTATLFNDRYASRRIYYHEAKDAFYFAAEAKALLAVRPELRALDERGAGEYIACGCVLEDRTLFRGVSILPWAAAWVFRRGVIEKKGSYFSSCAWEEQEALDEESYFVQLRDIFSRDLHRYFGDTERIGVSLTGGLDTRMILAWHKADPRTVPCYTFGGSRRDCRDVRIARLIARMCGQSHEVICLGSKFLARFPELAERTVYLTDGSCGVDHAPDLYANQVARQIAPIRMTGNFGDEVLRRRTAFRPSMPQDNVYNGALRPHIAAAADTYADVFRGNSLVHAVNQQISWCFHGLAALEGSQLNVRTPFSNNELVRTAYRAPANGELTNDVRVQIIRAGNPALSAIRSDLGFAGRGGPIASLASQLFHRATMRAEYACEHGNPRWVSQLDRALLGRRLEKTFVGIHKFAHFSLWYRKELSSYVREMLLDKRTLDRPYLQADAIEPMVRNHLNGSINSTPTIHKLISLEHIHRLFLDAQ
jgi:asparagine synthase (glutamine-hydrolysing)